MQQIMYSTWLWESSRPLSVSLLQKILLVHVLYRNTITMHNPKRVNAILDDYLNQRALKVYVQTTALGFVTGIRSMSSLALLGWTSDKSPAGVKFPIKWLPLVAALGEAVADKLPVIPSRTLPGPFTGRLIIGGVSGLILCRRE